MPQITFVRTLNVLLHLYDESEYIHDHFAAETKNSIYTTVVDGATIKFNHLQPSSVVFTSISIVNLVELNFMYMMKIYGMLDY